MQGKLLHKKGIDQPAPRQSLLKGSKNQAYFTITILSDFTKFPAIIL
jgi:hypothetical protein